MQSVIVFDDRKGLLSPLNDLRPTFDVRTGALTLLERLRLHAVVTPASTVFRVAAPALAPLVAESTGQPANAPITAPGPVLIVNSRWIGADAQSLIGLAHDHALLDASGNIIAAKVGPKEADRVLAGNLKGIHTTHLDGLQVMTRPWHIRSSRDALIRHDLDLLLRTRPKSKPAPLPTGVVSFGENPVHINPSAKVCPGVILDAESGPIFIDANAVIRPGVTLCGPTYIGAHSTILDRALIKAYTAIGPHCKVAGEVGGTIFQGFANKSHDGHLGDSWVGQWVNLGAGTTNSNLLNTYDQVICRAFQTAPGCSGLPGPNERTGEQFLGCILGDHVKTAICTRIMTGAIVGTGTMWAATTPLSGSVMPFTWATDAGTRSFRADKFIDIARTVMARRNITPSDAYFALLRSLIPKPTL